MSNWRQDAIRDRYNVSAAALGLIVFCLSALALWLARCGAASPAPAH